MQARRTYAKLTHRRVKRPLREQPRGLVYVRSTHRETLPRRSGECGERGSRVCSKASNYLECASHISPLARLDAGLLQNSFWPLAVSDDAGHLERVTSAHHVANCLIA